MSSNNMKYQKIVQRDERQNKRKAIIECSNEDLVALFVNVFGMKESTVRYYLQHPQKMENNKSAFDVSKLAEED